MKQQIARRLTSISALRTNHLVDFTFYLGKPLAARYDWRQNQAVWKYTSFTHACLVCLLPSSLRWGSNRKVPHFVSALVFMGKWDSLCTHYWQEQNEVGGCKWVGTTLLDPLASLTVEALKGERKKVHTQIDQEDTPEAGMCLPPSFLWTLLVTCT